MFHDLLITAASEVSILLGPIFFVQGKGVRRRTPKLPEAIGPTTGSITGNEPGVRLLFFGESTIAGVGASSLELGLVGQTARALAQQTARSVHWQASGKRGVTVQRAYEHLLPLVPTQPVDLLVVAIGVNDVLKFHRSIRYQRQLAHLINALRQRLGPVPVLLPAVPAIGRFPVLPQPLRVGLGLRAHAYNVAIRQLTTAMSDLHHVTTRFHGGEELLCQDRFHPSQLGYAQWGEHLAHAIASVLAVTIK